MEKNQQLPPELTTALRDYEIAMRDGGQREQAEPYERLLQVQQEIGGAAIVAFFSTENTGPEQRAS